MKTFILLSAMILTSSVTWAEELALCEARPCGRTAACVYQDDERVAIMSSLDIETSLDAAEGYCRLREAQGLCDCQH